MVGGSAWDIGSMGAGLNLKEQPYELFHAFKESNLFKRSIQPSGGDTVIGFIGRGVMYLMMVPGEDDMPIL